MDTFRFLNIDRGTYLDVAGDICKYKPVELREVHQGVEFHEWQVQEGRIVSTVDPSLCLGVGKISEGERIIMVGLEDKNALQWKWGYSGTDLGECVRRNGDSVVCVQDASLRLGPVKGSRRGLELQKPSEQGQLWEKREVKPIIPT